VYGNGYKLDATPYAKVINSNEHPNNRPQTEEEGVEEACYYLMSDNTVLDNVDLVGNGDPVGALKDYQTNKQVLAVYGIRDSIQGNYNIFVQPNPSFASHMPDESVLRQAKNIKILNSTMERGRRAFSVIGAPDEANPIYVESCVFRYTGDHAIWLATNWESPNNDGGEYKAYVTLKNIITAETQFPPIGLQQGCDYKTTSVGDGYGGVVPSMTLEHQTYGVNLKIEGDHNYIYNWLQMSKMDFGEVGGFAIADFVQDALTNGDYDDLLASILYQYGDNTGDINDSRWFNLAIFGNYRTMSTNGDGTFRRQQPNVVDFSNSNLQDILLPESNVNVDIQAQLGPIGITVTVQASLYFCSNQIPDNAPNPQDDLSVVVPQKITEMQPATAQQ